jgi:hypothetical protein
MRMRYASILLLSLGVLAACVLGRSLVDSIHYQYHLWCNDFSSDEIRASSILYPGGGSTFIGTLTTEGIKNKMDFYHTTIIMQSNSSRNFSVLPLHIFRFDRNTQLFPPMNQYRDESASMPYFREPIILAMIAVASIAVGTALGNRVHDQLRSYSVPVTDTRRTHNQSFRPLILIMSVCTLVVGFSLIAWYISFDRTTGYRWTYNNPYLNISYLLAFAMLVSTTAFAFCARYRSSPPEVRTVHNHCRQCGYLTEGSSASLCPECGTAWGSPSTAKARRTIIAVGLATSIVHISIVFFGVATIFPIPINFGQTETFSLQFSKLHAWLLMSPAAPTATDQTFLYWLLFR